MIYKKEYRSHLKKVFSSDIGVEPSYKVLDILQYACGLILGLALISTENPNFEMAYRNLMEFPAMNLFVYGTLRIPSVMYAVTVRRFRGIDAVIKDYARYSVKGESYPGIIPATNAVTDGIVYLDVDELSLKRLDEFEGDLYQRTPIPAETGKGEIYDAETYVIKPEYQGCLTSKEWHLNEFFQNHLESFLKTYSGFQKKL